MCIVVYCNTAAIGLLDVSVSVVTELQYVIIGYRFGGHQEKPA